MRLRYTLALVPALGLVGCPAPTNPPAATPTAATPTPTSTAKDMAMLTTVIQVEGMT